MNCAEVAELLGVYALDALPAAEKAEVERHLATCDLHGELVGLLAAAATVPFTSAIEAPPPALRERIFAAIAADDPAARPTDPLPVPPRPMTSVTVPLTPLRSRRLAWAPYALAAAFAAISLGLLLWNVVLLTGDDTSPPRVVLLTGTAGSGAVVLADDATTVHVGGMPELGAGQVYQLWVIEGGEPEPAGLLAPESGAVTHTLDRPVAASAVIAITVEPAGGSPQPTSDPVLVAEL
jgi:anti-sigma-K factor RskA